MKDHIARSVRRLAVLFLLLAGWHPAYGEATKVVFTGKSVELDADQKRALDGLVLQLSQDPALTVAIDSLTDGLKPSSRDFIVAKTRSLKIFQALVVAGIDPARLVFMEKQGAGDITISTSQKSYSPTAKLKPDAAATATLDEFTLTFDSGLAEPQGGGDATFQAFLRGVGQPGHDALSIEGKTDSTGNADYNKALSELRALRVFENLVRSGLPPYRITTSGVTSEVVRGKTESAEEKQKSRRVIVRWIADEKIAAIAAVEDKKNTVPAETPEAKVESQPEPLIQAEPELKKEPASLRLLVLAGVATPASAYTEDAKPTLHYGLGIERNVWNNQTRTMRASLLLSRASFPAKDEGLTGAVNLLLLNARTDLVWALGTIQPFLGAVFGSYRWDGTITQRVTGRNNSKTANDSGAGIVLGFDRVLDQRLLISPEITWHVIGGAFSERILTADICLRWSL